MGKRLMITAGSLYFLLGLFSFGFAQGQTQEETFTITTYYPSPYGSYNELSTNRFSVGAETAPIADGVINFKNLSTDPQGIEGALYYNSGAHNFKYHNGSGWKDVGTGGVDFGKVTLQLEDGARSEGSCSVSAETERANVHAYSEFTQGKIRTRVRVLYQGQEVCDSGYKDGFEAKCPVTLVGGNGLRISHLCGYPYVRGEAYSMVGGAQPWGMISWGGVGEGGCDSEATYCGGTYSGWK